MKTVEQWIKVEPIIGELVAAKELFWTNPAYGNEQNSHTIGRDDIRDAEERLKRFAPYIAKAFPETKEMGGMIESPLVQIASMQGYLEQRYEQQIQGSVWLKCDSHLPISGSIKARGGIYEVLKHAEELALSHGRLALDDNYEIIDSDEFRSFFSQYSIAVGSTGNLGLSIGVMGARLGFRVTVHMSADAKQWKKDLLRSRGVTVIEYTSDYSKAVEEGRKQADADPTCYFIDDENSKHLFLGYAVAASRLQKQLAESNITVDEQHPLFVYLPCGVGGGPGGVAFGLKQLFGAHVHCFFAEPTHSPCMALGLVTGLHDQVSVQDFGLDNKTEADGLAVGRPSRFVGKTMEPLLSGVFTVQDDQLFVLLSALRDSEGISLEPSALAGMPGPVRLCGTEAGKRYVQQHQLTAVMGQSTHIVWATGGSMVPSDIMEGYYEKGKEAAERGM